MIMGMSIWGNLEDKMIKRENKVLIRLDIGKISMWILKLLRVMVRVLLEKIIVSLMCLNF